MGTMVSVSEARANLAALIGEAQDHEVVIIQRSKPTAVLISHEAYEGIIERLEDLEDALTIAQRDPADESIPLAEALDMARA